MARQTKTKETSNSRLLKDYASWIYCESCNKTIAYLCYVTYNHFDFEYKCNCGNEGSVYLDFEDSSECENDFTDLIIIKNRLCCPYDESPLLTIQDKNLLSYQIDISCKECQKTFHLKK